jgi:arabinofuranosyltransferase
MCRCRPCGLKKSDLAASLLILSFPLFDSLRRMYVVDDAFISFRYARNLAEGLGLVFNPGERVEGYTNFLWTLLMTPSFLLGLDPLLYARILSVACAWVTLALLLRYGRRFHGTEGAAPGTYIAPVLLAFQAPFSVWLLAGMETHLFTLFVTAGILSFLEERREGSPGGWPLLFVLASLTRPEGILFLGLAWLLAFAGMRRGAAEATAGRSRLLLFLPFLLLFVPYLLWKIAYYGSPVPNTFHAKVGYGSGQILRGLTYMKAFAARGGGIVLATPVLLLFSREGRKLAVPSLLFVLPYCLYVILVGGDSMAKFRFVLPVLPVLSLMTGESLSLAAGLLGRRWRVPALAGAGALAAFLSLDTERTLVERRGEMVVEWIEVGRWLAVHYPPETSIALGAVGAIPYYSGLSTIDIFGLTEPRIARKKTAGMGRGLAGHEKADGAYVISRKPDLIFPKVILRENPPGREDFADLFTGSRAEMEIWSAPLFRESYSPVTVRLAGGYLTYYERKK